MFGPDNLRAERELNLDEKNERRPAVSVVVVIYNIPREAPRTLRSLSAAYQRHIGWTNMR